jgi:hypothetical protein
MRTTNRDAVAIVLIVIGFILALIAFEGLGILAMRQIHIEPFFIGDGNGVHVYVVLPGEYQVGGGVTASESQFTGGLGIARQGLWARGEGIIVDWRTQAIVRMSDQHLLWYW